jgi:hypothetical protein
VITVCEAVQTVSGRNTPDSGESGRLPGAQVSGKPKLVLGALFEFARVLLNRGG